MVGKEITPLENQYFRWDTKVNTQPKVCSEVNCFKLPVGYHRKCAMHLKEEKQIALRMLISLLKQVEAKKKLRYFMMLIKKSKIYIPQSTVISLGDLVHAFRQAIGFELSLEQLRLIRSAYGVKSDNHNITEELDLNNHDLYDVHLDIIDTLQHSKKTNMVLDTYDKIIKTDTLEKIDDECIDFFGATSKGIISKVREHKESKIFNHLNELAEVVGDGKLPLEIREKTFHSNTLQGMKDKHLGLDTKYDFFKYILMKLKDLDPDRNGYVTNQELEDCFVDIYPQKLRNTNLKKIFNKYASI